MHKVLAHMALEVAAVARRPGGCDASDIDDLGGRLEDSFYLLQAFLRRATGEASHRDSDDRGYYLVLQEFGIIESLPVLCAMEDAICDGPFFHRQSHVRRLQGLVELDKALQDLHGPGATWSSSAFTDKAYRTYLLATQQSCAALRSTSYADNERNTTETVQRPPRAPPSAIHTAP
jgi:hypothetical protein